MYYAGISSNIMSLAGIAIAIGVLVDAGIVVTENAFRFLEQRQVDPRDRPRVWATVLESTQPGGTPGVLLHGDHHAGVRPRLRPDGTGRQALPSARLYQNLRRPRGYHDLPSRWCRCCARCCSGAGSTRRRDNPVMRTLRRIYRPALEAALRIARSDHRPSPLLLFAGALVAGAEDRQRVHAAAQRRRSDVHADRRSRAFRWTRTRRSRNVRTRSS